MQFVGGILVFLWLPNLQRPPPPPPPPPKKTDEMASLTGDEALAPQPKPSSACKWLFFLFAALFFDGLAGGNFKRNGTTAFEGVIP